MDTSSGSPTLDGRLMSTLNCGSSSSSTGQFRITITSRMDNISLDTNTSSWHLLLADRQVLDTRYGLKRWQIGEVASKIGQLYYHY